MYVSGTASLTNSEIVRNVAMGSGGGIVFLGASLTLAAVAVNHNKAASGGGREVHLRRCATVKYHALLQQLLKQLRV